MARLWSPPLLRPYPSTSPIRPRQIDRSSIAGSRGYVCALAVGSRGTVGSGFFGDGSWRMACGADVTFRARRDDDEDGRGGEGVGEFRLVAVLGFS